MLFPRHTQLLSVLHRRATRLAAQHRPPLHRQLAGLQRRNRELVRCRRVAKGGPQERRRTDAELHRPSGEILGSGTADTGHLGVSHQTRTGSPTASAGQRAAICILEDQNPPALSACATLHALQHDAEKTRRKRDVLGADGLKIHQFGLSRHDEKHLCWCALKERKGRRCHTDIHGTG